MIGKAAAFSLTDNDPVRIFGLPKKMLLEVRIQLGYRTLTNVTTQFRILSKPCSVIRDVTLETVELMKGAREKSSRDTRAILSMSISCSCFCS
jgi:small subunit ribosomal protein S29